MVHWDLKAIVGLKWLAWCRHKMIRDILLSYIVSGDCIQVLGSLSMLATLLQTKELDESMLDALGILPQRK
ncbi:hypothetical protein H6P81_010819 [Aristolochia fimbriata]|uniref:Uncharacterized protein n=1 Tax=Aristolochia fimbriata TaxID=158543 RepID=A0AAV7EQI9_ARIFI|nr:hypothetical protein H6P81_010819 [Aristolochia fimbriata]